MHLPAFVCHPSLCQTLAAKLGQAPANLLLGVADTVIAHMMWFNLDNLEHFTEFVESVMQPQTFIAVVTVGEAWRSL